MTGPISACIVLCSWIFRRGAIIGSRLFFQRLLLFQLSPKDIPVFVHYKGISLFLWQECVNCRSPILHLCGVQCMYSLFTLFCALFLRFFPCTIALLVSGRPNLFLEKFQQCRYFPFSYYKQLSPRIFLNVLF